MNLEKVKLGELYTVHNGLSKGGKYFGKGFPFLSFSTVFNNYFLPDKLPDLVQSTDAERENYDIKKGDVFITRTSETSDELGMTSVALKDYPNATYNGFTKRLRPLNSFKVFPKYIGYYLRTQKFRKGFMAFSTMTTRASLKNEDLLNMEIWLPSYSIQINIADKLSLYDDLIENNQKQIKLLEEAAQRLYKEWFVDLHFPGYEQTKIVDGLPEGWRNIVIGDLNCRLESGSRPKGGIDNSLVEGIPSIGAENVLGLGKYNYTLEKLVSNDFFSNMKKGKLIDKDILIYKDGAYIGKTSLFQDSFPYKDASVNEHVFLLHTNDEMFQYYLFFTLYQSEYYMKMQKLNKNSAQPGINAKALLSLDLILPSSEIIGVFNQLVTPFVQQIFNKAKQNHKLEQARNRLLPKLMNGEIEI